MGDLQIEQATKRYGRNHVIEELSLAVRHGELVTLLGPSGCGKSTLLKCIAGLEEMEQGRIVLAGRDITHIPPKKRGVGMVFQSYALFPNMNVEGNISFGMKMAGLPAAERARRTAELLLLVGLTDKLNAYPHQLSGGQQQRVALARSLAAQPKLLLLDEPLSALDARIRRTLRTELRQLQKQLGMTMIFVTHDQEEALTLSDRVCIMNEGRIVQEGTPEQIYARPNSEFAARFIGNYNVLDRSELAAVLGGASMPDGAVFAIRPEAIRFMPGIHSDVVPARDGCWIVSARVDEAAVLGGLLRYTVTVNGVQLTVDCLHTPSAPRPEPGTTAALCLPCEECRAVEGAANSRASSTEPLAAAVRTAGSDPAPAADRRKAVI